MLYLRGCVDSDPRSSYEPETQRQCRVTRINRRCKKGSPLTIVVPQSPSDIDFPEKFKEFRLQQTIAAARICDAFERTDDVILQAPPGVGKTLLSLLLAKMVAGPRSDDGGGTVITTGSKLLQKQYLDDFPDQVFTATGRDNWPCLIEPTETAKEAACTHGWACPVVRACDYVVQRDEASAADVAVLNTAYYLYEKAFTSKFAQHDLAVFDEAHLLEQAVLTFAGRHVSKRLFERLALPFPNSLELGPGSPWAYFWQKNLPRLRAELHEEEALLKCTVVDGSMDGRINLDPRQAGRLRDLRKVVDIGRSFSRALKSPDEWILSRTDSGSRRLRPLWGAPVATRYVRDAKKRLYLSASILSPEFLAFTLGLKDYEFVEMPSDFPAAKRPLLYLPTVKMNARAGDDEIDHLVRTMDAVLQARHLGQKGIIHTVSYKLRDQVMERSKFRSLMVTHNAADRIQVLEKFKTLPEGYVLVSPSMTTGVDLPEDQCRWQFLPKMPYPYLGDELVRMRKDDERLIDWNRRQVKVGDLSYAWATATALVQAYGRAMRSADDWGYTYCFDSNFWSFKQRWGGLFPAYFHDAVQSAMRSELGVEL